MLISIVTTHLHGSGFSKLLYKENNLDIYISLTSENNWSIQPDTAVLVENEWKKCHIKKTRLFFTWVMTILFFISLHYTIVIYVRFIIFEYTI